jgi:hypothetical protein
LLTPSIDARAATRVAARAECVEAEALDFWDYGMLYAFDIIERRLLELANFQPAIPVADVLRILTDERQHIYSEDLYAVYLANCESEKTPLANVPAADRSKAGKGRGRGRGTRISQPLARTTSA